ncbi:MAG TPA: hypothetical protein VG345_12295 [Bryobacteraceae bacterium]|nr:hypothetical protein [Bryobacteraceae bacterium]
MPGRNTQFSQSAAILKAMEAGAHADVVREHVHRIAESAAFKGSERSREFLLAIVEKTLAGRFEDLKERVLGAELFGRSMSYDTGEDAIVRVTASDVRRRLTRYYAKANEKSDLRIEIPVGSYIPEFIWSSSVETPAACVTDEEIVAPEPAATPEPVLTPELVDARRFRHSARPLVYAICGFVLGMLAWVAMSSLTAKKPIQATLPWSALLQDSGPIHIVMSDTDLSKMQSLGAYDLSLSDYANRQYLPGDAAKSPELTRILQSFRGLNMGATDVNLAFSIFTRVFPPSRGITVVPARALQLKDFRADGDFIMLGSPRSNPWVALFEDQLDFSFYWDAATAREALRNRKPRKGEPATYWPSARGWGTGEAFGLISFIANPNQTGHVLLIAGSSAEATEAAGRFALDREAMAGILKQNSISPEGSPVPFQTVLRVNTMAGSPGSFAAAAFHRL